MTVGAWGCNKAVGADVFTFKPITPYVLSRKNLTYILGARCTDGIVLVGDRRITRGGGSIEYEDKIFSDVRDVVIGASGVVGLFDKFREQISVVAASNPDVETADFIRQVEGIVYSLNNEYRSRGGSIDLLVAYGRIMHGQLQYITRNGIAEEVRRYEVLGSGGPYGAYLLRAMWRPTLTMKQAAVLGALIVRHIEDNDLDEAVGVGKTKPQIWFVPDWPSGMTSEKYGKLPKEQQVLLNVREISETDLNEIEKQVTEQYPRIGESLDQIVL